MTTRIDSELKREIMISGTPYTVTLTPDRLVLALKGRRKGLEIKWLDLVSGEAALATALNASLTANIAPPRKAVAVAPKAYAARGNRGITAEATASLGFQRLARLLSRCSQAITHQAAGFRRSGATRPSPAKRKSRARHGRHRRRRRSPNAGCCRPPISHKRSRGIAPGLLSASGWRCICTMRSLSGTWTNLCANAASSGAAVDDRERFLLSIEYTSEQTHYLRPGERAQTLY